MIIKRGRLTESGVELGGLGFIGDIQGFWKRAPFILVTGIAHIWWLAQLTAVPGNKIGTDMCRIFLIAVTTTPFTPIAADAFPKTVTIVLTGMTFPGISGIFNNSCALYFLVPVPVQYKFVQSVLNVFDYEWYSYFYSW